MLVRSGATFPTQIAVLPTIEGNADPSAVVTVKVPKRYGFRYRRAKRKHGNCDAEHLVADGVIIAIMTLARC